MIGISVTKDVTFYYRWKIKYPKSEPHTICKTFAEAGGDVQAMRFVLKKVWEWHLEENPTDECPHDLDSVDP